MWLGTNLRAGGVCPIVCGTQINAREICGVRHWHLYYENYFDARFGVKQIRRKLWYQNAIKLKLKVMVNAKVKVKNISLEIQILIT